MYEIFGGDYVARDAREAGNQAQQFDAPHGVYRGRGRNDVRRSANQLRERRKTCPALITAFFFCELQRAAHRQTCLFHCSTRLA
jgi:hypothetical protein